MTATAYRPLALLIAALFAVPGAPCLAAVPAPDALPTGGRVTAGAASIAQSATPGGTRMDIKQSTERAILEWQTFNIGSAAQVNFSQPSASSIALNRVLAGDASQIMGRLSANGQVYLVNPAGVIFGAGSRVDVGGLVASTLDIADGDFLAGRNVFNRNGASGKVVNSGTLNAADGGLVALLAPEVRNEGVIAARLGNVVLAAGERVTLEAGAGGRLHVAVDPATINALVENRQMIVADGGQVVMSAQAADRLYSAVVANSGKVQARTLENRDGRILLLADMDHGEVQVGGLLDASAPGTGNGGFVETSAARVSLAPAHRVTTLAANGKTGTWLIDPNDYTIAASGGNITGTQLASDLAASNITISTATQGTAGGNGDIFVNDAVSWSANTTLSLQAQRDININAPISATGNTAGLTLGYGAGRDYYVNAPITLSGSAPVLKIGVAGAEDTYIVINSLGVAGDASTTTLQGIKNNLTGKYALGSDIDASATVGWNSGAGFEPITGSVFDPDWGWDVAGFSGILTGLKHTINKLTINRPGTDYVGLIGYFSGAQVRNVGLLAGNVIGHDYVGGLVGMNDDLGGIIKNTFYNGTVQGDIMVGGLIGHNRTTVSNSFSAGTVTGTGATTGGAGIYSGNAFVGGLVGESYHGPIDNSYSTANVTGIGSTGRIGGLVGDNDYSSITNSYSTGSVSGPGTQVGGLVGINRDGWGNNNASQIVNSYWNIQTSGQATSSSGTGKTTAEMKQQASFAGWDFTNTWRIYEGQSTPVLRVLQSNLAVTANNATKTYDGNAWAGGNGVSYSASGAPLTGSVTYTGTAQGAVNAGSYIMTPGGLAFNRAVQQDYQNWGGIIFVDGALTVSKAPLAVIANAAGKTYDGNAYAGGNGVSYAGFVNGESAAVLGGALAYGGNSQGAINAGSYAITPSGRTSGNYTLTFNNGTLTINPAAVVLAGLGVGADNKSKTYGGSDPALTWQITSGTLQGGDSLFGSLTRDAGENVGSYAIRQGTLSAGANYSLSFVNGVLTIGKAPLIVSANNSSKTYDGAAFFGGAGASYSGFVFNDTAAVLGGTLAYGGNSQGAVNAGSYAITPSGVTSGNYTVSFVDGVLTIAAAPAAPPATPAVSPVVLASTTSDILPDGGSFARTQGRERRAEAPMPRLPEFAAGPMAIAVAPHLEVRADFIALPGAQ